MKKLLILGIVVIAVIAWFALKPEKTIAPDVPSIAEKVDTQVDNVKQWPCEPYPDCKG